MAELNDAFDRLGKIIIQIGFTDGLTSTSEDWSCLTDDEKKALDEAISKDAPREGFEIRRITGKDLNILAVTYGDPAMDFYGEYVVADNRVVFMWSH